MTERLHRQDPYLLEFEAAVVARREHDGRPALILDRTGFYAESGGQPWDTGTLGDARVLAVIEDGADVLHVLDRPVAGERVNVPIYSGGLTSARTREAVALQEQTRMLLEQSRRSTEQLSRTSYLGVTTAISRVTAYKQALASSQAANEATLAGYEVGTRTSIDVLALLREQYRAERDYARARYEYITNLLLLKQAAGMLSREDVVQVNQWLMH